MRRQSKGTPAHRGALGQIELFAEESQRASGLPAWSALPSEARAALTNLMMRLILDHANKSRVLAQAGGAHDL